MPCWIEREGKERVVCLGFQRSSDRGLNRAMKGTTSFECEGLNGALKGAMPHLKAEDLMGL